MFRKIKVYLEAGALFISPCAIQQHQNDEINADSKASAQGSYAMGWPTWWNVNGIICTSADNRSQEIITPPESSTSK